MRAELERYGHGLAAKPEVVALNKCDALSKPEVAARRRALEEACGGQVAAISGHSGAGVPGVLRALYKLVSAGREAAQAEAHAAHRVAEGLG